MRSLRRLTPIADGVRAKIFVLAGIETMLEMQEKHQLEDSMGFRGQLDEHRRFQFAFLKEQGLRPTHKLLEIGCGPLTSGLPLVDYLDSGNYIGVDVRSSVLDMAWKQIGKAKLSAKNPRLIRSSTFGADELREQTFDFIVSFSVLFHLDDEILDNYFKAVRQRLASGGKCLATINTTLESSRWLEFPFLKRTIADYRAMATKAGLRTSALGQIKDLGLRSPWGDGLGEMLVFQAEQGSAHG